MDSRSGFSLLLIFAGMFGVYLVLSGKAQALWNALQNTPAQNTAATTATSGSTYPVTDPNGVSTAANNAPLPSVYQPPASTYSLPISVGANISNITSGPSQTALAMLGMNAPAAATVNG